jgi:ankyrin repeat protein
MSLISASKLGDLKEVTRLLNLQVTNLEIIGAFVESCNYGYVEIAKLLLENGADVKQVDIRSVCYYHQLDIIKLLVTNGLDIITSRCLEWAEYFKRSDLIDYLNNQLLLNKIKDMDNLIA